MGETSGTGPFTTISGGSLQSIFSPTAAVFDLGSSTTSCGTPPTAVTFNFVMWNADVGGPTRTLDLPLLSGAYPASASRVAPPLLLGSLDAGLIGMSPNETESNPWSPLFPSRALSAPPPRRPAFEAGPYVTALFSQARIHQSSTARHAETRRNSSTCLSAEGGGGGGRQNWTSTSRSVLRSCLETASASTYDDVTVARRDFDHPQPNMCAEHLPDKDCSCPEEGTDGVDDPRAHALAVYPRQM